VCTSSHHLRKSERELDGILDAQYSIYDAYLQPNVGNSVPLMVVEPSTAMEYTDKPFRACQKKAPQYHLKVTVEQLESQLCNEHPRSPGRYCYLTQPKSGQLQ